MTTAPAAAALGANSLLRPPPALKKATSTPSNEVVASSRTLWGRPSTSIVFPALRAEAMSVNRWAWSPRCSMRLMNSLPTAPVAPTMATLRNMFTQPAYQY